MYNMIFVLNIIRNDNNSHTNISHHAVDNNDDKIYIHGLILQISRKPVSRTKVYLLKLEA